jgi:hypothetical protein
MPVRRICLLAALLGLAAFPTAARADSVVYLKDGQVWIANPDGSGARQFTQHAYGWASPSEADDGTVVVAGGLSRINADGSDSDGSSEIYRFQPDGNQIGTSTPTWGSRSTPACPAYPPSRVRVSPDGSKIAYGIYGCGAGGYETTLWTPAGSTGLDFPGQTVGQQDFWNPIWIDSSRFTISHAGPPVFGAHWGEHLVTDGDNVGAGWAEPSMTDRTADVATSRDGTTAAAFFEDSAGYTDGKPRNVSLLVYHSDTVPSDWTHNSYGAPVCQYDITPASDFTTIEQLDPSLSPDGTKVMYGDKKGVELKSLGDVTDHCAGASGIVTLIPGGSQPFYAKGNLQPGAANPRQPAPPGPAPTPTPSPSPTPSPTPAPTSQPTLGRLVARFRVATKLPRARRKVAFDARKSSEQNGRVTSYAWTFGDGKKGKGRKLTHKYRKAAKYKVTLTVRDAAGHTAKVTHTIRVKH